MARRLASFLRSAPFDGCEDPDAAPGAYKGPQPLEARWSFARARQNLLWVYAAGLVFLVLPLIASDSSDGSAVVVGWLVAIAVGYLATAWVADASLTVRRLYILGYIALIVSTAVLWGWSWSSFGVYPALMVATLVPWRQARPAILVWGLVLAATAIPSRETTPVFVAATAVLIGLVTGGGFEAGRVAHKLARAEQRVSTLAVAAERERIGRDLHDILGHSLTTISVKSALAARLVDADPAAARHHIIEVQEIARQALNDVRATASGYREVRVATEVASARSILLAAGIEAHVPSAIDPMPSEVSELFGYVVREAVTNVIRHSGATECTITVSAQDVTVRDNGTGVRRRDAGSGITGLTDRVEAAGGVFTVESLSDGGTRLRAVFTGAPSETARDSTADVGR